MKDYYYILGLNPDATEQEIKQSYRKLSMKFHPDKNDGDNFFNERFKEINEAYSVLVDVNSRRTYDESYGKHNDQNKNASLVPSVIFFKSNKQNFHYGDEITFSWHVVNATKVSLKPFGSIPDKGTRTFKINNLKNEKIPVELLAERSGTIYKATSTIILINETYKELYLHFKNIVLNEKSAPNDKHSSNQDKTTNAQTNNFTVSEERNIEKDVNRAVNIAMAVLISLALLLFLLNWGK